MDKKKKRVLMGTGVIVASAAAAALASYGVTKLLLKIALDREAPNNKIGEMKIARKRVSGIDDKDIFYKEMAEGETALERHECESIKIASFDGIELVGHWVPSINAERTIIAMHGWRSSWKRDFGAISDFWYNSGCNVLYIEQRGQNNSGGDYMGFGLIERYDCIEWIKWVKENKNDALPIYLCGISMGATTVLMASGLGLPAEVKGIVADCGFTSPHEIWRHVVKNNLKLSFGLIGKIANDMCKKKISFGSKEYSTLDAMKVNKTPVLFIHGSDDHFVPIKMTFENYKACVAPKRLLVVPGAEHGMSYFVDKKQYEEAFMAFWKDFD